MRTDLPVPRVKRVSDRCNYGDEADAYAVVNPSIFSLRGIHEKDFLLPRSKTEVRVGEFGLAHQQIYPFVCTRNMELFAFNFGFEIKR